MPKAAIVVLADTETPEDLGRVVNALTTAKEFKEAGDDVTIVFDGAGTKWIGVLTKPDHKYARLFDSVKDRIAGACDYCSRAYGARDEVDSAGITLLSEFDGHPSLRTLVADDYQAITF